VLDAAACRSRSSATAPAACRSLCRASSAGRRAVLVVSRRGSGGPSAGARWSTCTAPTGRTATRWRHAHFEDHHHASLATTISPRTSRTTTASS
jgi:hypothetical protein